jgi:hypothetical protein
MNPYLIENIHATLESLPMVSELQENEAQVIVERFASLYVSNAKMRWWWEALKVRDKSLRYDSYQHWLEIMESLCPEWESAYLVVTDDEFPPWPVLKGPFSDLLELIGDQFGFEYFITGIDYSWCVFDNHHDYLIMSGDVLDGES